ncbi:uncharacterized protein BDR25DRAFT_351790 [Lindgomyces ingoldianus]|uniref:Uncharacterized protein n=1 Tax=Lindgomyces ingoldianus TaxID=673940 RepID=A0ACB6R4L8_9PLEO|nr:uncharacterized protein BDR25DRAFT_351790 [Lindgomyces ingoldianus]KAF2474243.1 hypothetical protein BDR25DRAFT_351790 [Lindgomyces ingoldianus]
MGYNRVCCATRFRKHEAQKGVKDSIDRQILEETQETQGFAGPRALQGESEASTGSLHDLNTGATPGHSICTSAAPFFFKPKDVNNLDIFQDGGLQHNNPAFISSWECAFLWPSRYQILGRDNGRVDYMISLGIGTASSTKCKVGPILHEKQWKTFIDCVPTELRSRYFRLNPQLLPVLASTLAQRSTVAVSLLISFLL